MKKLYLLMLAMLSCIVSANAQTFEVDGFKYEVTWEPGDETPGNVRVISNESGYAGNITIPAEVTDSKTYKVTEIGSQAFEDCTDLTSITIPNSVTSIGDRAFKGCTGLTSVTIPNSVTYISWEAFHDCISLTSITIPNSVTDMGTSVFHGCSKLEDVTLSDQLTTIPNSTFYECSNLTSITIPNSVTTIEGEAFCKCSKLTEVNLGNKLKTIQWGVFRKCESLTSITIPNSVINIGIDESGSVFEGCTCLESITIPANVTIIKPSTFNGCTSLTKVTFLGDVTAIGNCAFWGCSSLEAIEIPNTVTKIENSAFQECASLTDINIPTGVKKIDNWTFGNCASLESIIIPSNVTSIGEYAFTGCTKLLSITIPASVTEIKSCAFQNCSGLTTVTSELMTPIKIEDVFDWQSYEAALVVPKGARDAYKSVNGWKEFAVTFEVGETVCASKQTDEYGINYNLVQTEDYSTYYKVTGHTDALKAEIVISAEFDGCPVKAIAMSAFNGCTNLTSVTIPNSVTTIGECSFSDCTGLKAITIPKNVTTIGNSAFSGCDNVTVVTSEILEPFAVESSVFGWWLYRAALVVPEGKRADYKKLNGWNEFAYTLEDGEPIYDVPTEQTDEQGLTYRLKQADDNSIYYSVTGHTEDLKGDIVIPAELDGCPVGAIEDYVFQNCFNITSLTFHSDVNVKGTNGFYGCINLKDVTVHIWDDAEFCTNHILKGFDNPITYWDEAKQEQITNYFTINLLDKDENEIIDFEIPEGVTSIGDGAFKGYTSLSSVTIPKSVTSIGANAFKNCDNLISIKMGKNVTSIGDNAFYNCSSLQSIQLPKKLESIGSNAFSGDDNWIWSEGYKYIPITSITIPGSVKTIGNGAFNGCRDLELVTFETVEDEEEGGLTSIGNDAFRCCVLTSITLPNTVTTIGSGAFAYNYKLTTAVLGESLTGIGDEAFRECIALTSVTIPDGVTSIGTRAFKGCYQFTSVKIPQSLTSIGEDVFDGCQLKSIDLPDGITAIPANLFKNNDFEYIKLGNNVKSIGKNAFGCKLQEDETLVVIEIATSTPPTISNEAFPKEFDVSVINVIVPDEKAEVAYKKANVWKNMTYANLDNNVEVTMTAETAGELGSEILDQTDIPAPKVVGLKVKGTISPDDFMQMKSNMKSLLRLDLSECDITEIPDEAMTGKTQLQELTLPKKLQTIGQRAFQGCPYLTGKLDLPASVTSIGSWAFEGTYYTSVTIPKALKSVGDYAFYNLPLKQTLNLPTGMTGIGAYAFADTQIYGHVEIPDGIKELGDGAFRNTQIKLASPPDDPNGITTMNWALFQGCSNLEYIYIPRNFTQISGYAFDGCSSMEYVRLSPNLTSMGEYAFQNTSMEYINVPAKVNTLAKGVFKNCKNLESLALPANLKEVSPEALYGCSALRNMSVEAIEPPAAEKSSFVGVNTDLCLISFPTESYKLYRNADYWGLFVQMRNDIAVTTEGNGNIAFESVEEEGEEEEAMARARVQRFLTARARTRGTTEEEVEPEMIYVNNGSSVYVPQIGNKKVRFFIIPGEGEELVSATLDGKDITKEIVGGVYTATADKKNGKLVVKFSGKAEVTEPVTIGKNGKTTLTSSEALDFSGFDDLKAYVATGYEGNGTIWLTRVKQVPANTPILVKGEASTTYDVPVMDYCDAYYENLFQGSAEEDTYLNPTGYEDGVLYNYFIMAGGQFKPSAENYKLAAGKCYLRVPGKFNNTDSGEDQTVKIADSGKSSYAPPVAIDVTDLETQGLKAYTATGYDAATSVIWLTRVNKIPAGTGVILKGEGGKTYTLPSVKVEAYYGNMFVGNIESKITINEISDDGLWKNFYLASGEFKPVSKSREIGTNKSYLHLPTYLLVSSARGKSYDFAEKLSMEELETETMLLGSIGGDDEDGTTRIDAIGNESGQPGVYYNLQGQRVDNPGKGVYIKNGKKVIIK